MNLMTLKNKVALITGATSGIGEALAQALVREEMRIIIVGRNEAKVRKLEKELDGDVQGYVVDVGNASEINDMFQQVKHSYGHLDLLCNNAGLGYFGEFSQSSSESWKEMIDVNLLGVLHCTQQAIPLMKDRTGAMIMSVASVAGRRGIPNWSVYSATKFAVVGFHDALRQELGPLGIRVSLMEPGAVYTNWGYGVDASVMKKRRDDFDALHANDIANAILYAFAQPGNVNYQEMVLMPTRQVFP